MECGNREGVKASRTTRLLRDPRPRPAAALSPPHRSTAVTGREAAMLGLPTLRRHPAPVVAGGGPPSQPRSPLTRRRARSRAWALLRLPRAIAAAAIAGLLALVGMAAVSPRPAVFLLAGLAVFVSATAAGVALATRKLPNRRRRRTRLAAFAAGALAGVTTFVVTALLPVSDPRLAPAPVAGQRFWELPTGSRVAYVHVPAHGTP